MTRATAPDRRRAFLVRTRPLPTFRVRSASGEPSHLVVLQSDGALTCNCTAAQFRAADCSHRRIARRSIERRVGVEWTPDGWRGRPLRPSDQGLAGPLLTVITGGRA
jgi:hypothetical protein